MLTTNKNLLKELIVRVQLGEQGAYEKVIQDFQDMAVGYGYSILGDVQLAEDVAQEAFIHAYYDLPKLRDPAAFPGWFRRIVFTQVYRLQRSNPTNLVPLDFANEASSVDPTPIDVVERDEMRNEVLAAIAALPEHQRTVVMLFYINEYSQKEISAFLEIPVATVKTRLHAARKRLKERMIHTLQDYLIDHRPSKDKAFIKEMNMDLALGKVVSAGSAGCQVRLIETGELFETRYSLKMQDQIKIRPEQIIVVDRYPTPPQTVYRLYLSQIVEINGEQPTVELLRDEGDRGMGRVTQASLAEGVNLQLNVDLNIGDDVYGHDIIYGRSIDGIPADPKQLLATLTPIVTEIYEGDTFQLDPNSAAALTNRGNVYLDQGKYDQAIEAYNQALVVNPSYVVAYTHRGHTYEAKGDSTNAIADYKRVIAILEQPTPDSLPNNHPIWHQVDISKAVQTRLKQAKEHLAALGTV